MLEVTYMQVVRKIVKRESIKSIFVPEEFGDRVEIIVLPVSYEQDRDESEYFECVAEDGTVYRLKDWTDEEFNKAGMMSACKDDGTIAEEIFDV
jgi:hypothetical protein